MEPTLVLAVLVTITTMTPFGMPTMPITPKRKLTGIVVSHQLPLAEFIYDEQNASAVWRIWLNYDREREHGTFILLAGDGSIVRQTIDEDGTIRNVGTITPAGS